MMLLNRFMPSTRAVLLGAEPLRQRGAITGRHRIGVLTGQHALVVDVVHEGVAAGEAVKLDALPFGGSETVCQQHLARLILVEDRGVGRRTPCRLHRGIVHEARMENVGSIFQMQLPVAAVFEREARICDLDLASGARSTRLSMTSVIGAEVVDQRRGIFGSTLQTRSRGRLATRPIRCIWFCGSSRLKASG